VATTTNDIKNGTVLDIDGQLWQVIWFQHHKPGKGNTKVLTKLKNVLTGKVVDRTFMADTKIDITSVDKRDMQYLYQDATGYVFMDTDTYDQLVISEATVGDAKDFMLDGTMVNVAAHEGVTLYIELPPSVELEITYTEPGLQGDRSSAGTKPATLETGREIQVPLFITAGEKVKVDTRTGEYLGRSNG
jgi:elongation factor P